jgi:hypothetical protein
MRVDDNLAVDVAQDLQVFFVDHQKSSSLSGGSGNRLIARYFSAQALHMTLPSNGVAHCSQHAAPHCAQVSATFM